MRLEFLPAHVHSFKFPPEYIQVGTRYRDEKFIVSVIAMF
jgi:hypothetical protein